MVPGSFCSKQPGSCHEYPIACSIRHEQGSKLISKTENNRKEGTGNRFKLPSQKKHITCEVTFLLYELKDCSESCILDCFIRIELQPQGLSGRPYYRRKLVPTVLCNHLGKSVRTVSYNQSVIFAICRIFDIERVSEIQFDDVWEWCCKRTYFSRLFPSRCPHSIKLIKNNEHTTSSYRLFQ